MNRPPASDILANVLANEGTALLRCTSSLPGVPSSQESLPAETGATNIGQSQVVWVFNAGRDTARESDGYLMGPGDLL
jgi:hypothetical protein